MTADNYRTAMNFLVAVCALLVVVGGFVALWAANPSSKYLQPEFWSYNSDTGAVTFRRVLSQPVTADWRHEIVTTGGMECSASGSTFYGMNLNTGEINLDPIARFPLPPSLAPCIETGEDYVQRLQWTVLAFDIIPLRPVELQQTFTLNPPALEQQVRELQREVQELRTR